MYTRSFFTLLLTLWLPLFSAAQWVTRAPSSPRGGPCSCTLGGYVYLFGGGTAPVTGIAERFDPATNTWTTLAPMSPATYCAAVAGSNGKIYVMGGYDGSGPSATVQEYDPGTNTWTTRAPMLGPRYAHGAAAVGSRIYVFGGWNGALMNTCEAYDVLTNTWTARASFTQARYQVSGAELGGLVYAVGGFVSGVVGTTDAYDPATNTWTPRAPLSTARYLHGVAAHNGAVYAIAGYSGMSLSSVEAYNPSTNTWSAQAGIGTARYQVTATSTATCLYALGGTNGSTAQGTNQELCLAPLASEPIVLEALEGKAETYLRWHDTEAVPGTYLIEYAADGLVFEAVQQVTGTGPGGYEAVLPPVRGAHAWIRIHKQTQQGEDRFSNVLTFSGSSAGEPDFTVLSVEPGAALWLEFEGVTGASVHFRVIDITGKAVTEAGMEMPPPGKHVMHLGFPVSSGVYMVIMTTAGRQVVKRIAF